MLSLENTKIKASFSSKGAELRGLFNKDTSIEYMWSGDPNYWGKYSPILFPIVGGLKDNTYLLNDQEYALPRHGFARDQEFEVETVNSTTIIFTLKSNSETLLVYPFEFQLLIKYELLEDGLRCSYEVSNPSEGELLFSIGAHPAFSIATNNGLEYADYYLDFDKDSSLTYHKIQQDLIDDETVTLQLEANRLPLKYELFYDDALVFKTLQSNLISIRNTKNKHGLDFGFEGFPYFGIWAAKNADFVCLEPWCGIADGINHNQQLIEKEGIVNLAGKQTWKRSWEVKTY